MNHLERFLGVMEYKPVDRVPNWELGAWPQARERWENEGCEAGRYHWNWFPGEESLGMDPREFIPFDGKVMPSFEEQVIEEDDRTITYRGPLGRTRRALKVGSIGGARMSMDQYIGFPVRNRDDWESLKKRLDPLDRRRFEPNWKVLRVEG